MKLLFGLIGAALGAIVGEWSGAFIGAILGVTAALVWRSHGAGEKTPDAKPAGRPTPLMVLTQRLQALEQEVAGLRAQVRELALARSAGTPVSAPEPAPASAMSPAVVDAAASGEPAPRAVPELLIEPAMPSLVDDADPPAVDLAAELTAVLAADAPAAAARPAPPAAAAAAPAWAAPAPAANAPARRAVAPVAPPAVPWRDRLPPFVARWIFGGNTIVKGGVLILFLGLAFLLRYTAERVTLPPELRYAGVALVGAFLLGLGWRLRERRDKSGGTDYGLILQGAGVGVFYLTALAALRVDPLLSPALAFAFMATVSMFGALLAVAQDAPWLAYVSVAEGFAAPVLVGGGSGAFVPLFSYMAILDAGLLAIAWFKAWRPLNLVGAVATFTLAGGWAQQHDVDADYAGVQAYLLFFFLLFTVTGVLFARRALAAGDAPSDPPLPLAGRARDTLARVGRVDSSLTFGVPLAAFTLQYLLVRQMPWGPAWAASAFALFHILLGGALMRGAKARYALLGEAHVIVGAIFGTLAVPLALQGVWTGATWAIEAAGMYWLGARQRRSYARAFALAVLAGAAVRLLAGLWLDERPGLPLIQGSVLGMGMLAVALVAMDAARRRMPAGERGRVEAIAARGLPFAAALAFTALAWMLLPMLWAGAATAWIAFGCAALQRRLATPVLQAAAGLLHVVALVAMTVSLQPIGDPNALGAQARDLAAALLIGAALLATGWLGIRDAWRAAAAGQAPAWSPASSAGLVAGIAVVSASLLFVTSAAHAALAWPWIGVFVMWLGSRLRHPALVACALVLQLVAAATATVFGPPIWHGGDAAALAPVWAPLGLTIAGFLVGDLMRRADAAPAAARRRAGWHGGVAQHLAVGWVLLWWWNTLPPVLARVLEARAMPDAWPNVVALWVTLSSVAIVALARWRDWAALGRASLATLPLWILLALAGPIVRQGAAPSAHLGGLAWPLALAWHPLLLRWQARWRPPALAAPLHVVGFWLFVALATCECALRLWPADAAGAAWGALAAMLVPALVLVAVSRPAVLRRWPFSERRDAYLVAGCAPVALSLLAWLWAGNATAGDAAPLPYLPLLNPLEIGQALALLALALWARALPAAWRARVPRPVLLAGAGATAFALVTGLVLRACHHEAGIAWNEDALWGSTLAQAALSVTWAVIGVALMMTGHRGLRRAVWLAGAALLGGVVAKLFLVELADRGSLDRIVSFIVVGALMLVVGYFAPMPPRQAPAEPGGDAATDTLVPEART